MTNSIIVEAYNPNWPRQFEKEADNIQRALGENCIVVHHIGSTSVPGLKAKPIIDIVPVVNDIQNINIHAMQDLGYEYRGEAGMAFRQFFQKPLQFNVHIYKEGDPEIMRYLKFRDWLRHNDEDAKRYEQIKVELAEKFPLDLRQYCMGKEAIVLDIDAKTGYEGWRMVQALTDREWEAVRSLRNKNFFKEMPDPFTWTFNRNDHIHFVFYKNNKIVGYCHLQLWLDLRAAIRIFAIDESYRRQGLGKLFLSLCERWLRYQGYRQIVTQSNPKAVPFYKQCGYVDMPFKDPENNPTDPNDLELGKNL